MRYARMLRARTLRARTLRARTLCVAALACVLLAACTGPGTRQETCQAGVSGCAAPGAPFSAEGRISVRYGDQSLSGKFTWSHNASRDELGLASPLGNQLARIVRDASGVVLTNSDRQSFRAADVESLTEARLGWRLPLAGLTDWVRGRPQGSGGQARRDEGGRLTELKEAGWVIEYSYGDPPGLPRRLILTYPPAQKPLEIRLVIDSWNALD